MAATQYYSLPDGRRSAYCEYGDPTGSPMFYLHGWPGSRLEGTLFHEAARQNGLWLVAPDRPGLGRSDELVGRSLLSDAQDLARLADHLGWESFALLGWDAGCAPALACAYSLPTRVSFLLIASPLTGLAEYPSGAAQLPRGEQFAIRARGFNPLAAHLYYKLFQLSIRLSPGSNTRRLLASSPAVDQEALADRDLQRQLIASQHESVRQGAAGISQDAALVRQDWGLGLGEVQAPVHIFQGSLDGIAPPGFAVHLAEQIPNAVLHLYPEAGHFLPLTCQKDLFCTARAELDPETVPVEW